MLQGFIDDSGSDGLRAPFVLAGYILPAGKWDAFSKDWRAVLNMEPRIEYFKMSEAAERIGQFAGVREEFCKCKIRDLLAVIQNHNLTGIHTSVDWNEYREILEPKLPERIRNPYHILFPGIMDALIFYQKRSGIFPTLTDLDFDEQGRTGQFAVDIYPLMKAAASPEMGFMLGRTPNLLDDKKVVPLQAADLLAWSLRREFDPEDTKKEYHWLFEEVNKTIFLGTQFTRLSLEAAAAGLPSSFDSAI